MIVLPCSKLERVRGSLVVGVPPRVADFLADITKIASTGNASRERVAILTARVARFQSEANEKARPQRP